MRILIALLAVLCVTGCFGWGDEPFSERTIVGKYRLKAWEDGSFYLRTPADTGDIMADEPVQRIGWDPGHVVVLRGIRGAAPRWSVIDVANGRTHTIATVPAADSTAAHIHTMRPDSAWARLGLF